MRRPVPPPWRERAQSDSGSRRPTRPQSSARVRRSVREGARMACSSPGSSSGHLLPCAVGRVRPAVSARASRRASRWMPWAALPLPVTRYRSACPRGLSSRTCSTAVSPGSSPRSCACAIGVPAPEAVTLPAHVLPLYPSGAGLSAPRSRCFLFPPRRYRCACPGELLPSRGHRSDRDGAPLAHQDDAGAGELRCLAWREWRDRVLQMPGRHHRSCWRFTCAPRSGHCLRSR